MTDFRTLIRKQLDEELIYGCVVMAGDSRKDFLLEAYGFADRITAEKMKTDSIFDLASITKPVGCATLAAICQEEGLLNLDRPFTDYLPKHRASFEQPPTVRQLGAHISGLDCERPYDRFQFMRMGYYSAVGTYGKDGKYEFNQITGLKDSYGK